MSNHDPDLLIEIAGHDCDLLIEIDSPGCKSIKQRHCSDFQIYTGETIEVCREIVDCHGKPVSFAGVDLQFRVWDRRRKVTIDVLATGTKTGFCVTIPAQGKQTLSSEWAVRDSTGQVVASGPFVVRGRP